MKIGIGADHGGYDLKIKIIDFLKEKNIEVQDFGTNGSEGVDYADYAKPVAEAIINKEIDLGILICGTGIGMSLAANKVKGIRAACVSDSFSAKMARAHNDANILCFGARVIGDEVAKELVGIFISQEFEGGRHQRRVDKIMDIEK